MAIAHGAPLTSVPTATDGSLLAAGTDADTTRTPCGGGQPGEPWYAWRTSSCWIVTSDRPSVATPRKNRPKYLPSRSAIVSHGLTARLAQPASVRSTTSELTTQDAADGRMRMPHRTTGAWPRYNRRG